MPRIKNNQAHTLTVADCHVMSCPSVPLLLVFWSPGDLRIPWIYRMLRNARGTCRSSAAFRSSDSLRLFSRNSFTLQNIDILQRTVRFRLWSAMTAMTAMICHYMSFKQTVVVSYDSYEFQAVLHGFSWSRSWILRRASSPATWKFSNERLLCHDHLARNTTNMLYVEHVWF